MLGCVTHLIMKTSHFLLVCALAVAGAGAARAFDPVKGPSSVEVTYFEKEKFTDVKDGWSGTDRGRDDTLATLKEYITQRATKNLSAGQKLAITITDVDLAGDFEPWRGSQWMDVRVVKDIYPPRINIMFRLTDSEGKILKEEKRELIDTSFLMSLGTAAFRDDPLRHEKQMLSDWINNEFKVEKPKKS